MMLEGTAALLPGKSRHPYLSGNFAPIERTRPLTPCEYEGTIPDDLAGGQYVRNGGNPLANEDLGRAAHWFDGDGMLSGVHFRRASPKGEKTRGKIRPEFVNQYLLTDVFEYAAKSKNNLGRPVLPSIATLVDPCASALMVFWVIFRTVLLVILSRLPGRRPIKKISVANTSVVYHDGRALALCESGVPMRFALPSLETIGWFNGRVAENEGLEDSRAGFGGEGILSFMKEWTVAHPKVDPDTNEMIAFHSVFIKPFVYYSIVGASSPKEGRDNSHFSLPVPGVAAPKMMHDFGASRNFTVIMDLPLSLDPFNLFKGKPALNYDENGRSRFGVFPRYSPDAVRWFETSACCIFHTANCWDTTQKTTSGDEGLTTVHLLACRLTSASMVFTAGNLIPPARPQRAVPPAYADERVEEEQCRLYYYAFPMSPSREAPPAIAHQFALSAIPFEFPAISPRHSMHAARFIYGCSSSTTDTFTAALGKAAKVDIIAKIDVQTLIARGTKSPPDPTNGCVDTRDVATVLNNRDSNDPIQLFKLPEGHYAQEPRFVPRRDATSEDDGYLLSYVFDESQLDEDGECPEDACSELWIIDAKGMANVVARIKLPQRVPYGLHGTWFDEKEIQGQRGYECLRTLDRLEGQAQGNLIWEDIRGTIERWIG